MFAVNPGSILNNVMLEDVNGSWWSLSDYSNPQFKSSGYYPDNFSYKQNGRTVNVTYNGLPTFNITVT